MARKSGPRSGRGVRKRAKSRVRLASALSSPHQNSTSSRRKQIAPHGWQLSHQRARRPDSAEVQITGCEIRRPLYSAGYGGSASAAFGYSGSGAPGGTVSVALEKQYDWLIDGSE